MAKLKNTVCIYTNHVRAEIGNTEEKEGPQGGAVMAHASDIRIRLGPASQKEHSIARTRDELEKVGLKLNRAKVVDCGFLPRNEGYYLMGAFGIGDPAKVNILMKQAEKIKKDGFLSVNSVGDDLDMMDADTQTRDEIIEKYKKQLYGTA